MRNSTIYLVVADDAIEGEVAAPTLKEAREIAREEAEGGGESAIRRATVRLTPTREMVCRIFNRAGFVVESELVETYVPIEPIAGQEDRDIYDKLRWRYRVDGR